MEALAGIGAVQARLRIARVVAKIKDVIDQVAGAVLRPRHAQMGPDAEIGAHRLLAVELPERQAAHQDEAASFDHLATRGVQERRQRCRG